ncbi:IclR family transcriptional regulator [Caballeronia sp. LZ034LL]|uniref:IclR family transcriptional regulator n=1 Tax=Caballeronia sp. LZ034LL TaxID=3038567 RepID=UPI0028576F35|nr:IclR family transcriptional regulator [Caballeronia sp. LZ034LL]MDR5836035.1 IclR family transcriptional regulator [Caballeronia sp. LZ034LL]
MSEENGLTGETLRPTEVTADRASARNTETGSLARGLQVMNVLHDAMRALAHAEVADAAGLPASTAYRLLQTLVEHGQVERTRSGRYRPSARSLLPLVMDHPLNTLRRDSMSLLRGLCDRHGPSASLILFFGEERAMLESAPGRYSVTPYYDTHLSAPYHTTVSGKLLLAHLSPSEREALLSRGHLSARTHDSITDPLQFEEELQRVLADGFATNQHENVIGICACGAVLKSSASKAIGALVLSGPSEYFSAETMEAMKRDLLEKANMLSHTSLALRAVARFLE